MASIDAIPNAATVRRIVARCIHNKAWRAECETEACSAVERQYRKTVVTYVHAEYEKAGAGFMGRWQT